MTLSPAFLIPHLGLLKQVLMGGDTDTFRRPRMTFLSLKDEDVWESSKTLTFVTRIFSFSKIRHITHPLETCNMFSLLFIQNLSFSSKPPHSLYLVYYAPSSVITVLNLQFMLQWLLNQWHFPESYSAWSCPHDPFICCYLCLESHVLSTSCRGLLPLMPQDSMQIARPVGRLPCLLALPLTKANWDPFLGTSIALLSCILTLYPDTCLLNCKESSLRIETLFLF